MSEAAASMQALRAALQRQGYIADTSLACTLALAQQLRRPLLIEGEAGVGKTELAKALAGTRDCELIRLQCYEGLDVHSAVYDWNYQRQLLAIRLAEAASPERAAALREEDLFSSVHLLERPLLRAITREQAPVLLIDEIDRADEEFEAYLLEVLSDFQISIPELGTIRAKTVPAVLLTSNATRELSDALRRRCLYHYLEFPSHEREVEIVVTRVPDVGRALAGQIVGFVQELRQIELRKKPGIAETLDWAAALTGFKTEKLQDEPERVLETLSCLIKTREDRGALGADTVERLLAKVA
ncbi:AAA family ATPase [Sinimarinibacterium flocculans]|uniref:Dynein-related subfamily AAA family protein n=1 Tax=Sinimarinibacterium flocculans TaxID=985250 RepID=A0A318E8E7_9GAMM|nr:MoxR family ATPase [Sinimarinibacterium flocculans]PXV65707.1 dynein-related subfamily AAA family protein [Sinimarinibacterium flocculans]